MTILKRATGKNGEEYWINPDWVSEGVDIGGGFWKIRVNGNSYVVRFSFLVSENIAPPKPLWERIIGGIRGYFGKSV